jgi:hypothetical protein
VCLEGIIATEKSAVFRQYFMKRRRDPAMQMENDVKKPSFSG